MTLLEYMNQHIDEEIAVHDVDYDMETYFYGSEAKDEWDKAMQKIAGMLEVKEVEAESPNQFYTQGVTVNLSETIEKNLDKIADLFIEPTVDAIMDDIEVIFAGNVHENWLADFANALDSGEKQKEPEGRA